MKNLAVAIFCLFTLFTAAGCGYGPAHLDAFYAQRNHYQHLIDDIERQYSLRTRDAEKTQAPAMKETIVRLEKENEVLKAQVELLKGHSGPARN